MPRVRLIHWNGPEGRERQLRLASLGFQVEFDDLDRHPHVLRAVRSRPPDAFLIDLSRLPSHGREVGMALRTYKDTRHVPLVFVDGDPSKVAKIKALLPDATYTTWGRLKSALPRAMARQTTAPVVPPSSIYSGKPAAEKLGIKAGMRVALLGAPRGFADSLTPKPAGVTFTARPAADVDLYMVVARSRQELAAHFAALGRIVGRQTVWVVWPKVAAKVRTDLNGNVVRETGLALGWVDFKVCSIDNTFSGLAFKRRQ